MLPVPLLLPIRLSTRRFKLRGIRSVCMILWLASIGLVACGSGAPAPSPSASSSASASAITPSAESVEADCGRRAVVDNTDGQGVNLRASPGGDVVTAYPDGTQVTICTEKDADGQLWYQVQGEDGAEGWLAAEYVFPAPEGAGSGG